MFRANHAAQGWATMLGLVFVAANSVWAQGTSFTQIQRGRYLSKVGDCMACHTAKNGKSYAGGFPVPTPFGTIFSSNITPDLQTGIGKWSNDDFYKAMHSGIGRDGKHLYPAFPYPWYTKMTRSDVDAIKAYLDTLTPVAQPNKPSKLPWPLSTQAAAAGWQMLFFHAGEYQPVSGKSDVWNRGAYLVEGGAHCAACHTPKNMFGATKDNKNLLGGDAGQSWFAPSLSGNVRDGIGAWSTQDIVDYLKTGANRYAAAAGPMTEVIMNSTQYLTDADLKAMAVYLKDLPGDSTGKEASPGVKEKPADTKAEDTKAELSSLDHGRALYTDNCVGCHMARGTGQPHAFPALKGSPSIQAAKPDTIIQVILAGSKMADPKTRPTGLAMPAFAWKLSDSEIADLTTYIRNAWGNRGSVVTADAVAKVRKDVHKVGAQPQGALNSPY